MKAVALDPTFFEGFVSLETGPGWFKPWRIPFEQVRLFPPDGNLAAAAECPAGVRLRFRTGSRRIAVAAEPAGQWMDLTIDGRLVGSCPVDSACGQAIFDALPAGRKTVEVWLSPVVPVTVRRLMVEDDADAAAVADARPKWIAYGSSITHCMAAHSPARTYPATAARRNDLNLTCLGFGGQCHLDWMVARTIRELPADVITLKVGINIMGGASLSVRTFRPALVGFILTIREKHPTVPLALVSPILSPPRETTANLVGMCLRQMREEIQDIRQRLIDHGDRNLHYFDGRELFGQDLVDPYLPDLLHPNADGYEILGANFAERVLDALPVTRPAGGSGCGRPGPAAGAARAAQATSA